MLLSLNLVIQFDANRKLAIILPPLYHKNAFTVFFSATIISLKFRKAELRLIYYLQ